MISKMRDDEVGSRIGIVMNGSPLFTGGAGSGESEIRRWMLENDWVEAIVALPADLFYNTGIQTYVWLLTNRKDKNRAGRVQLIDASSERFWKSLRKNLGSKRKEIPEDARREIVRIYEGFLNGEAGEGEAAKIFPTTDFGYREIRIERPLRLNFEISKERLARFKTEKAFVRLETSEQTELLEALGTVPTKVFVNRDAFEAALSKALKAKRTKLSAPVRKAILSTFSERDEKANVCLDADGKPEADTELRDHELVPLGEDWRDYLKREVLPFAPDAWVDESYTDPADKKVGRVGYEISFNRYFYKYVAPRPLEEIDEELNRLETEIADLLRAVAA